MSAEPLQLLGLGGAVDRNGIVSIDVPMWVATLGEALRATVNLDIGIPLVSRSFKQSEEGGYEVTLHFEGLEDEAKEDQTTFEFDVSMSEDPIEAHPNFDAISEKYGWDEVERAFPKFPPGTATSDGSALGKKAKAKKNPLYGTESYLAVGAVFRKTYATRAIPAGVLRGIGGIVERPPDIGQFHIPSTGSKRNWLKLAPKIRRRGNSVEVTEEWMLSGPNGWNKDVYSSGQLESGGGSGEGLTSGGLTTGQLGKDGRGWIAVEVTCDKVKQWGIASATMVQVAELKSDDSLKARHPIAMLRRSGAGSLALFQIEFFNLQHKADVRESGNAARHFFWAA